jgi:hypothetical protein
VYRLAKLQDKQVHTVVPQWAHVVYSQPTHARAQVCAHTLAHVHSMLVVSAYPPHEDGSLRSFRLNPHSLALLL